MITHKPSRWVAITSKKLHGILFRTIGWLSTHGHHMYAPCPCRIFLWSKATWHPHIGSPNTWNMLTAGACLSVLMIHQSHLRGNIPFPPLLQVFHAWFVCTKKIHGKTSTFLVVDCRNWIMLLTAENTLKWLRVERMRAANHLECALWTFQVPLRCKPRLLLLRHPIDSILKLLQEPASDFLPFRRLFGLLCKYHVLVWEVLHLVAVLQITLLKVLSYHSQRQTFRTSSSCAWCHYGCSMLCMHVST